MQQETLKSSIVNLKEWIDMTKAAVDYTVLTRLGIEEIDDDIWSHAVVRTWFEYAIEDELNDRLEWAKTTAQANAHLEATIFRYVRQHGNEDDIDAVTQAMLPSVNYINALIAEHVGTWSWRIWHTYFRYDWVVLECDEDYRIKVFNEKVESGEWEV